MKRRTKIVCTLGPAVDSKKKIKALIEAGMNVARLNCSHGDWVQRSRWVSWIRELSHGHSPVGILVDLQGPKFRIGAVMDGSIRLESGQIVALGPDATTVISITQPEILKEIVRGSRLLLGDGEIELKVQSQKGTGFLAKVVSGGYLTSHRGITVVGRVFDAPAMDEKDRLDALEAIRIGADFIALSYVKSAEDIESLRNLIAPIDPRVALCAKIETRAAVHDLHRILDASDLVMVARGDLGLQMDIEEVPLLQKRIIHECSRVCKPVITATQMLESMTNCARPTRAEATDVANAVLDGTDALMLSAETATGSYPIESVATMAHIAEKSESMFDRSRIDHEFQERLRAGVDRTNAIAHAVNDLAKYLHPAAIVTTSTSGQTPRMISRFRPKQPVYCATWDGLTQRQLSVVWGVEAALIPRPRDTEETTRHATEVFVAAKRLKPEDLVIVTVGLPPGSPGHTNMVVTQTVEEILGSESGQTRSDVGRAATNNLPDEPTFSP